MDVCPFADRHSPVHGSPCARADVGHFVGQLNVRQHGRRRNGRVCSIGQRRRIEPSAVPEQHGVGCEPQRTRVERDVARAGRQALVQQPKHEAGRASPVGVRTATTWKAAFRSSPGRGVETCGSPALLEDREDVLDTSAHLGLCAGGDPTEICGGAARPGPSDGRVPRMRRLRQDQRQLR